MRTPFQNFFRQPIWLRVTTCLVVLGYILLDHATATASSLIVADPSAVTLGMVTYECLRILKNKLGFTKGVNRHYDKSFAQSGAKIGTVLNVRKPVRFIGRTGSKMQIEDTEEQTVPVTLNQMVGVDFQFPSQLLTTSIDNIKERYLDSAMSTIVNKVDMLGTALYPQIGNVVGTPGTPISDWDTYLEAKVVLDEECAPDDDHRQIVMSSRQEKAIVNALKGLTQDATEIKKQYRRGQMGMTAGFTWVRDNNIKVHTTGPQGGAPLVNGAGQQGSRIIVDGFTAAAALRLKRGDAVSFLGVEAVNPQNREGVGRLRTFSLQSDVYSDGSGNAVLDIKPALIPSGAYQNVTNSPANNAPIYVFGDDTGAYANQRSPQAFAMHRDGVTLAVADLELPGGTDKAYRAVDDEVGLSIRLIRDYSIGDDVFATRLDILCGWAILEDGYMCRVAG